MHKIGLTEPAFIVSSVGANDNNLFELAGKDVWEGTYSGATFPMPEVVPDDEEMQLFVERFSKDYPNEPTAGFSLTWENFIESFYTFDNWDGSLYAGVSFSENNHYGLTSMFMTQAQNGVIQPITETITFDPETKEVHYNE